MKYVKILFTISVMTLIQTAFAQEHEPEESMGAYFMRIKGITVNTNDSSCAAWIMPQSVTVDTNRYDFVLSEGQYISSGTLQDIKSIYVKSCDNAMVAVETMCALACEGSSYYVQGRELYFEYDVNCRDGFTFVKDALYLYAAYKNIFIVIRFVDSEIDFNRRIEIAEAIIRTGLLPPSL